MLALNIVKWKGRGTDYTKFCLPLKPTQKGENLPDPITETWIYDWQLQPQ